MEAIEVNINGIDYTIRYNKTKEQNRQYTFDVYIDDTELQKLTGDNFQFSISPAGKSKDGNQCWQAGGYDILPAKSEEMQTIWNKIYKHELPKLQFP